MSHSTAVPPFRNGGFISNLLNSCLPLWSAGVDFLFPPSCPSCNISIDSGGLCPTCLSEIDRACDDGGCLACGAPVGPNLPRTSCASCREERYAFDRTIRLGYYSGLLSSLCVRGRSSGSVPLLTSLATLLWERKQAEFLGESFDLIVPVPQYWIQRTTSPHNPPEILAEILAKKLKVPLDRGLIRKIKWTHSQRKLTPTERKKSLVNAHRVALFSRLDSAHVLLVDDVLTTGTTAHRISRVLKKSGAARVTVATIARAGIVVPPSARISTTSPW